MTFNLNNINTPGTMANYFCQLLSNRKTIGCLYDELDKANILRSDGKIGYFKFTYPDIGSKTYNTLELILLNNDAQADSLADLFADLTLDNVVKIFFAGRGQIGGLYCARQGGLEFRTTSATRFFNFTNPYQGFINVTPSTVRVSFCDILKIDNQCGNRPAANIFAGL